MNHPIASRDRDKERETIEVMSNEINNTKSHDDACTCLTEV